VYVYYLADHIVAAIRGAKLAEILGVERRGCCDVIAASERKWGAINVVGIDLLGA